MRKLFLLGAIVAALAPALGGSSAVAAPPVRPLEMKPAREILVPYDDLPVLLEEQTRRVLLSRREYDELLAKAKRVVETRAPVAAAVLAANYRAAVSDERATIVGLLDIDVLDDGLHALGLPVGGVGLRVAELDGKPAPVGLAADGRVTLFVEGKGRHTLRLELVAPIQTTAARQVLDVQLPTPAATRLLLTVPGDVEVKSGAAVISRVFGGEMVAAIGPVAQHTQFELLPVAGRMTIVMTLNSRLKRLDRVVVARAVYADEVSEAIERLHASFRLDVLHRAVDSFRFVVPDGFEVTDVASVQMSRWAVAAEGTRRALEVTLREETTGLVAIDVTASRQNPNLASWSMPRFEPLDVVASTSVVGVLLEDRLRLEGVDAKQLIPVDASVVTRMLPTSVGTGPAGQARLRPVLAFYAPQPAFSLLARFPKPPARLRVTSNLLVTLDDGAVEVRGGFALVAEEEKVFSADVSLPPGWDMKSVTAADGSALKFERYDEVTGGSRVHVNFPKGLAPGDETRFYIHARRTPGGWLDGWTNRSLALPAFAVVGAAKDVGAVAVDARDDMTVRPESLSRLTALDEAELARYGITGVSPALAYRYEGQPWSASLIVERVRPRITAQTFSCFGVLRDSLAAHYEIFFNVEQARTRELSFLLPATTPAEIAVAGLGDVKVKEFTSEPAGEFRRWKVALAERQTGVVKIAVDFQKKLTETDLKGFALPVIRADGAAYEWGRVSVEGSAELDVKVTTKLRKVDVGELVDASYQPGNRLLGVFAFVGELKEAVSVAATRDPAYELPPAIIEHAELATVLSAEGLAQTEARFTLRTKALLVELRLPEGATLWGATLDGNPMKPQKEGSALVLNLSAADGGEAREIAFVYEAPVSRVGLWSRVGVAAPSLLLYAQGGGASTPIPTVRTTWSVYPPAGCRVVRSEGTMTVDPRRTAPGQMATPELAVSKVLGGFYAWTGGVNPDEGLLQSFACGTSRRYMPAAGGPEDAVVERLAAGVRDYARGVMRDDADRTWSKGEDSPSTETDVHGPQPGRKEITPGAPDWLHRSAESPRPPAKPEGRVQERAGTLLDVKKPEDLVDRQKALAAETWALTYSRLNGRDRRPGRSSGTAIFADSSSVTNGKAGTSLVSAAGFRSLAIDLQKVGAGVTFSGLGAEPQIDVTVANERRLNALGLALALAVFLAGLALTNKPAGRKATYVLGVALVATIVPVVAFEVELALILNGAFYAAALLVPYYLLIGMSRWLASKPWFPRLGVSTAIFVFVVVVVALAAAVASAADAGGPYAVVQVAGPEKPVKVPDDAIIVPYDPESRTGVQEAQKLLVPYDKFVELWNLAWPDKRIETAAPSAAYAMSGAAWRTKLDGNDYLLVEGSMEVTVYGDEFASIPLPLQGGVLAKADLDGRPARLSLPQVAPMPVTNAPQGQQGPSQERIRRISEQPFVLLHVAGKGRHRLDLAVRMKLERQGGWRIMAGRVPASPATALTVEVPAAQTEVVLSGVTDRARYETVKAGQVIETALAAAGDFSVRWRPRVLEGQIDPSLTAESVATLDVREDQLRLAWNVTFSFRKGERDAFTVEVPEGWIVEKVAGANVRGWEVKGTRVDVILLNKARESESFDVTLWKTLGVSGPAAVEFAAPAVSVPGAARQSGQLYVRRSPLLDVRTLETTGTSRIDFPAALPRAEADESLLGVRAFQAFRFNDVPFTLKLTAAPVVARTTATVQTALTLLERERAVETRVVVSAQLRRIYEVRLAVPDDLAVEDVKAPGAYEWALTPRAGGKVLTVYLAGGVLGDAWVSVRGKLGESKPAIAADVPIIEPLDVDSYQGDVAVVVDPAYDVRAENLVNLESIVVSKVFGWVAADLQAQTRLALHYRGAGSGRLVLAERKCEVACTTVTNVRVTERSIEETILLNFTITKARIREVSFLLPAWMKDAQVKALLLRQKTVTSVQAGGVEMVRVKVELQDGVMDQLRVVVRHDRVLTGDEQVAAVPVVETGRTINRYVVLESAGRDEVEVTPNDALEPVSRQQKVWASLSEFLKSGVSQGWSVKESAGAAKLGFRLKTREVVKTPEARIGLATTRLVLDASGAYCGVQVWRMHNATEQFLEITLPPSADEEHRAKVWAALVAGEPVKPVLTPGGPAGVVRIPLVKTAEGDLDYEVVVKYGGRLAAGKLSSFSGVDMPLLGTKNVPCERSTVELWLPETFDWFSFGGTMSRVHREGDVKLVEAAYWNGVALQVYDGTNSMNPYARARADANGYFVVEQLKSIDAASGRYFYSDAFQKEAAVARDNWKRVQSRSGAQEISGETAGNHEVISKLFNEQNNARSWRRDGGSTSFNEKNITVPKSANRDMGDDGFNDAWFDRDGKGGGRQVVEGKPGPGGEMRKRESQANQPAAPDFAQKDMKQSIAAKNSFGWNAKKEDAQIGDGYQGNVSRYAQKVQQEKRDPQGQKSESRVQNFVQDTTVQPQEAPVGYDPDIGTVQPAGLTSLDVDVPMRGTVYRFTMPRGEVRVVGYGVSKKFVESLKPLGIVLVAAVLALIVRAIARRGLKPSPHAQSLLSTLCIILGPLGIFFNVFPIVGVIALAGGIVWKFALRRARRMAVAA